MASTRLIKAIQTINPSANAELLSSFDPSTLQAYLDRLARIEEPRGPSSTWSRTSREPAITAYVPSGA